MVMSKRSDRNSLYIESEGSNPDALKKGLAWLYQLSEQNEDKQHAVLAVDTKQNLENIQDTVKDLIGSSAYRSLQNDNEATVDHLDLTLATNQIRPSGWFSGPVLAVYPSQDLLDTVDGFDGATDVLVIPWNRSETESWIEMWNASPLEGDADEDGDAELITDPVLEEGLETLHSVVNVSDGVTHPLDRGKAIDLFKLFQNEGVDFAPSDVRAWLVAEKGWAPRHADDVEEIAEGVLDGKRFQYERGNWADDFIETLRERADH